MIASILKKLQIKHKLIIFNLLITGIVIVVVSVISLITEYISFKKSLMDNLCSQAGILASNISAPLTFNDQKAATETLNALKSSSDVEGAVIYASDGTVFATYRRPGDKEKISFPARQKDGLFIADNHLHIFHGIQLDREGIGTLYIRSDLERLYSLMTRFGVTSAVTLLAVFGLAYLLLSRWHRVIAEPILNLSRLMNSVSRERNYSLKANVYSDDEIGSLAKGFNEMLDQINQRDKMLQVEIFERSRAEAEVRALNEGLELKVGEKTRQLLDAQEELLRKEKLAILGQLSGCVGHELRNPLGVMSNAVYFLKNVIRDDNRIVGEYLDIIKQEIDNSRRIISDLLDFSRTKTPRAEKIHLRELIRRSLSRCAIAENVRMQIDIPESLPHIGVDLLQMGQVFQNLISNGVQSMPEGGSIRISGRRVQGSPQEIPGSGFDVQGLDKGSNSTFAGSDAYIEISVADNGVGISPENMGRLFQPLFTTKARGIGLGLTVCKNLTEANGGKIMVESEAGKGTTFTILLPVEG